MKLVKKALAIFYIIFLISVLSACNGSNSDLNDKISKNIEITVISEGIGSTFIVTEGRQAEVNSFTKHGYYLTGIYDKQEGGEKYFDSNGKSLGVWQENNPTTFYTQWETCNGLAKSFEPKYADVPSSYSTGINVIWNLKDEILNAVKGNLDANLNIKLNFRIKEGSGTIFNTNNHSNWIYLKDSTGNEAEIFASNVVKSFISNYSYYEIDMQSPARCARNGKIIIEFYRGNDFNEAYIRDVNLSVEITGIAG